MKNRKLTTPADVKDTISQVDEIITKIESGFKENTKSDENGCVKITIDGSFSQKDNQEVRDAYKESGWGTVMFQTLGLKTRWNFRKG